MDNLRSTQQFVTPTILKMPSINEIHFPKMKSRLNLQEIKLFKNQKPPNKPFDQFNQPNDKLVRSYSMSLLTIKKDLKNVYSPKKKRLNFNPENIIFIQGEKGQKFPSAQKIPQNMKLTLYPSQKKQNFDPFNEEVNVESNFTEESGEGKMRRSLYPGVKFESTEYAEKRTQFLKKFLPGLQNESSLTARVPKKKHVFNSKFIINKKQKDQLPDELITRKLVWDGKQMKKIDHNLIYRDIVEKSKNEKNQKLEEENAQNREDKVIEFMRLSAWEFHDDQKNQKDPQIKSSRN